MAFLESTFQSTEAEAYASKGNLYITFTSSAGSASVDLEAPGVWSAFFVNGRAKDWCSISTAEGKRGTASITVSVTENPDYDERSASINFVCGSVTRTLVVTQKQKDAMLLSGSRQDIGKEGGQFTVEIDANLSFEYSISKDAETWIEALGTRGLSKTVLAFIVSANESISRREGEIIFTSSAGSEVVRVYQEGESPTLVVSRDNWYLEAGGGQFSVDVRSNVDVSFTIPSECSWIHPVETRSMSTNSFGFSADENEGFTDRVAQIVFSCEAWGLEETVVVTQAAATPVIFVGAGEYVFPPEGGELSIEVTSNIGIEVEVPDSCAWIQAVRTRALETSAFAFTIAVNDNVGSRKGVIIFRNKEIGKEEMVSIIQEGETPTLVIGQNHFAFSPEGGAFSVELSSNLPLDVILPPGCDWIVPVETRTVTDHTHIFSVGKNHGRRDRSGHIVFRNEQFTRSDTVYVFQSFQPILTQCDTLKASGRGWTVSFETVNSRADDYRISFTDGWLSLSGQERVSEGTRFYVDVEAQTGIAKPRDAGVLVYFQDYAEPDTVWVHQYGKLPAFSFTTTARTVKVPEIEGDHQSGFVFWGDGTQEPWQSGLTHAYKTSGQQTVTIELLRKGRIRITSLEDGMSINFKDLRN